MGLLSNKLKRSVPSTYYDDGFKRLLRDHQEEILNDPETVMIEIAADVAENATGDFTSILKHYRIDPKLHWITTLINDMHSPMQYTTEKIWIAIPSMDLLRRYHTYYKSLQRI